MLARPVALATLLLGMAVSAGADPAAPRPCELSRADRTHRPSSRCLSCHDGTAARGLGESHPAALTGGHRALSTAFISSRRSRCSCSRIRTGATRRAPLLRLDLRALRKRQAKNFAALLFVSNGIPMFFAGDEFLRTQRGNNNPYNQDNELTWIDWSRLEEHRDVHRFFQGLIALRKAHPLLGHDRFWRERVSWYGVGQTPDLSHDSHSVFCLHGDEGSGDPTSTVPESRLYVMINAWWQDLTFRIQEQGIPWHRYRDLPGWTRVGEGFSVFLTGDMWDFAAHELD